MPVDGPVTAATSTRSSPAAASSPSPLSCGAVEQTFAQATSPRLSSQQQQHHHHHHHHRQHTHGGVPDARSSPLLLPPSGQTPLWRGLYDVRHGFALRLATLCVVTCAVGYAVYDRIVAPSQLRRPIAQRVRWLSPPVPITLLSKESVGEPRDDMYVFRFALPNSYDTTGYAPISSVQLVTGERYFSLSRIEQGALRRCCRWYTPISHPDARGIVEFAIRLHYTGVMSTQLRDLAPGDVVHLGRWKREFAYAPNTYGELGLICSTSAISVALQLMRNVAHNRDDRTRVHLLYCTRDRAHIAFRHSDLDALARAHPSRFRVSYNVYMPTATTAGGRAATPSSDGDGDDNDGGGGAQRRVYVGMLSAETIEATMPPPRLVVPAASTRARLPRATATTTTTTAAAEDDGGDAAAAATVVVHPPILVCASRHLTAYVCGLPLMLANYTYLQGPWFCYHGMLKDIGYRRKQVYKFGITPNISIV